MTDEILTVSQMRAADAAAIAAEARAGSPEPGFVLMRRAGEAVAHEAAGMAAGGRIVVLCGPGNNGGDGYVAAGALARRGFPVDVARLGPAPAPKSDAGRAAAAWTGSVLRLHEVDLAGAALVIDALFGAGLTREVEGEARHALERAVGLEIPILAVDVPSGVDGDTGGVRGFAARAAATVTFARLKPAHLLQPGRALCGRVVLADIGIADAAIAGTGARTRVNGPALWRGSFPRLTDGSHKYTRGHAVVLSGGVLHTGAARLAARGALRAGAGLVTLASPPDALATNAAHLTAVMLRRCDGPEDLDDMLADERLNAVALGPALGVGEATRALAAVALDAGRAVVLDADALTSHAGDPRALYRPGRGPQEGVPWPVLTPHEGEFARLFKGYDAVLDAGSKLDRARAAAALVDAVVVLKGPDTVIAAPEGRAAINANGTPDLATAGSGDVLAGIVAGLLAQGMPPFEAASAGVWMHAEAGRRFGPGLIAEDLPEALPGVVRELRG